MKKYSWVIIGVVLSLAVLAYVALSLSNRVHSRTVAVWQSYCAFEYNHDWADNSGTLPKVRDVVRPSAHARTIHLFPKNGSLYVWDTSNGDQFTLQGRTTVPAAAESCLGFESAGYRFGLSDNAIYACKENEDCSSIRIHDDTFPYVYAAQSGGVFVGTNFGDTLLFKGGEWCRMVRDGDVWRCPDKPAAVKDTPSNQFYSSISYGGATLLGEYPTGQLYEFDGNSVALATIPQPPTLQHTWEAQSLAFYCGDLYVGYWPTGEVHRFDGEEWREAIPLFSQDDPYPFSEAAEKAGLVANFFGRRVQALVPFGDSLYAAASSKSGWHAGISVDIGTGAAEYGVVHRIWAPGCSTTMLR